MLAIAGKTAGQGIKKFFFFQNPIFLLLFGSLEVVKNINVNILVLLMQV